jgi:hypothetical protein
MGGVGVGDVVGEEGNVGGVDEPAGGVVGSTGGVELTPGVVVGRTGGVVAGLGNVGVVGVVAGGEGAAGGMLGGIVGRTGAVGVVGKVGGGVGVDGGGGAGVLVLGTAGGSPSASVLFGSRRGLVLSFFSCSIARFSLSSSADVNGIPGASVGGFKSPEAGNGLTSATGGNDTAGGAGKAVPGAETGGVDSGFDVGADGNAGGLSNGMPGTAGNVSFGSPAGGSVLATFSTFGSMMPGGAETNGTGDGVSELPSLLVSCALTAASSACVLDWLNLEATTTPTRHRNELATTRPIFVSRVMVTSFASISDETGRLAHFSEAGTLYRKPKPPVNRSV